MCKQASVSALDRGGLRHLMGKNGFTLIEVLVAMLMLAGGLLGFALLQTTTQKNNRLAYQDGTAVQLANQLADEMRSNRTAIVNYQATSSAGWALVPACTPTAKPTAGGSGCTPTNMATNDLAQWYLDLANYLPSGTGKVVQTPNATAPVYNISVSWDSNNDGVVDRTYTMSMS